MESTTKEKNHNIIKALLLTINGIAIFAGVFVLISLLFPLVSYKVNVFGYNYGSVSENAYQFLRFYSVIVNKDWIIALVGSFTIFILTFSVLLIILNICSIFKFTDKKILPFITIAVCFLFEIVYMLAGVIIVSKYKGNYTTTSFIGLIVMFFIALVYIILVLVLKNIEKKQKRTEDILSDNNLNKKELFVDNYNVDNNESNDDRVIKLLNKYKSLLDNGVITQEEFNEKKQTLLKNY